MLKAKLPGNGDEVNYIRPNDTLGVSVLIEKIDGVMSTLNVMMAKLRGVKLLLMEMEKDAG